MLCALGICLLISSTTIAEPPTVNRWSSPPISTARYESHPAFDPITGALVFVRSSPQFAGWRLFVSECGPSGWSEPRQTDFAGDGVEADPFFSLDGRSLFFISSRAEGGAIQSDLDIWRVERGPDGVWGEPERLPEPLNSDGQEWFPRPARDGWLYFGSDRAGGFGATDIYRARTDVAGNWRVENLGRTINTDGDEYEAEISARGDKMIFMADGDLYESIRVGGGWSARAKLGPEVNSPTMEVGALLSPDGESFLFARDSGDPDSSGELYLYQRDGGVAAWPPACPAANR